MIIQRSTKTTRCPSYRVWAKVSLMLKQRKTIQKRKTRASGFQRKNVPSLYNFFLPFRLSPFGSPSLPPTCSLGLPMVLSTLVLGQTIGAWRPTHLHVRDSAVILFNQSLSSTCSLCRSPPPSGFLFLCHRVSFFSDSFQVAAHYESSKLSVCLDMYSLLTP